MCQEFRFICPLVENTNFLVFNAAKHSHSLISMQEQLEMSAAGNKRSFTRGGSLKKENVLCVKRGIKWCVFSMLARLQ